MLNGATLAEREHDESLFVRRFATGLCVWPDAIKVVPADLRFNLHLERRG
jgi:hypothetical protein